MNKNKPWRETLLTEMLIDRLARQWRIPIVASRSIAEEVYWNMSKEFEQRYAEETQFRKVNRDYTDVEWNPHLAKLHTQRMTDKSIEEYSNRKRKVIYADVATAAKVLKLPSSNIYEHLNSPRDSRGNVISGRKHVKGYKFRYVNSRPLDT